MAQLLIHFIIISILVILVYFFSSLSLSSSSVASSPVFTLNKNLHGVFVSILGIGGFGTHTYETSLAPIFVIGNNLLNLTFNNMFASVLSALIINWVLSPLLIGFKYKLPMPLSQNFFSCSLK